MYNFYVLNEFLIFSPHYGNPLKKVDERKKKKNTKKNFKISVSR